MNRLYIAVPRLASPLELVRESARHKNLSYECRQGIEEGFTGSAATGSGVGSFGAFVAGWACFFSLPEDNIQAI